MGKKAEAGTPKAIANASKAKGLQRLRFYCQVCEKQCRDENAFKQHSLSEGHVRQMLVVGESAHTYIEQYSKEFKDDFLALLSRRWGTKRVRANQVYQEFIQDKHHSHMNATQWVTLTGFVQWLGKEGICHVDETEKGWFISWIDNSPAALARSDAAMKKERQDMGDEERQRRFLNDQIERARAAEALRAKEGDGEGAEDEVPLDLSSIQPFKMALGGKAVPSTTAIAAAGTSKEASEPSASPAGDAAGAPEAAIAAGSAEGGEGPAADADTESSAEVPSRAADSTESAPTASTSTVSSAPSQPVLSAPKKFNAFKAAKANPLKANPLKAPKPAPGTGTANAPAGTKRPLSAVEAIVQEELERKRRKEQGGRGGPGMGSQRR